MSRPEKGQSPRPRSVADSLGELPARLREAREQSGLSLRQLAQRLEISASALSQIETGKSQPSVRTLYAVASELNVSLDELFDHHPETLPVQDSDSPVVRANARPRLDLESGVYWDRLTSGHDPLVDFLYVTYLPGSRSNSQGALLRHSGREYGLVLSGALDVKLGFKTYRCEEGDSVSFQSDEPHLLTNTGEKPTTAVWFVVGRGGGSTG